MPQFEQNLAPATRVVPHDEQAWLRADPHSAQNLADALFCVPQFEQTMRSRTPPWLRPFASFPARWNAM